MPGAVPFPPELAAELRAKWRNPSYRPRTRHLHPDGSPKYTNRLFLESSSYLLQHAHNPVNWYPWGDDAFETARRLRRPVVLSVGYSTCHWCHVMEEESFDDEQIGRYINENYVIIKVDRVAQGCLHDSGGPGRGDVLATRASHSAEPGPRSGGKGLPAPSVI